MTAQTKRVGLAIVGLGYMGSRALKSIVSHLIPSLLQEGIQLDVVAIVDKDPRKRERMKDAVSFFDISARTFESLDQLLQTREITRSNGNLLIYDASPSQLHFENLTDAAASGLACFAEKPILLKEEDLPILESRRRFWCNFIETESQVFRTTHQLLKDRDLSIQAMTFWREGSTGIKKVLRKERAGVTGGSLEDKICHDLALTVGFLGLDHLAVGDSHTISGRFELFMPNRLDRESFANLTLLEVTGDPGGTHDLHFAADARFAANIRWKLPDRTVDSEYHTSWVGVSESLRGAMQSIGLAESDWLGETAVDPQDLLPGYRVREGRIAYLECSSRSGDRVEVLMNFLPNKGFERPMHPWVKIRKPSKNFQDVPLLPAAYGDSLGGTFAKVIHDLVNQDAAPLLDAGATCFVHKVMVDARRSALRQPHKYELEEMLKEFLAKLRDSFMPFTLEGLTASRAHSS
jgi:predicted dehydrogenase